MISRVFTQRIDWNGITLEISYEPGWSPAMSRAYGRDMAHLQIRTIIPQRAPMPITETGYRSHFAAADDVTAAGGPAAYVRDWLAREAASPAWRKRQEAVRQMTLF